MNKKAQNGGRRFGRGVLRQALALAAIGLYCVSIAACRSLEVFDKPIPLDQSFRILEASSVRAVGYRLAAHYSAARGGKAVLVIEGDAIAFEEYQNGHSATAPSHIFSGTKTFAGVLAVAAVADGRLSLDELVADTIHEFREDPCKAKITVRHLLQFTSGLRQDFWRLTYDGLFPSRRQRVRNRYAHAISLPCVTDPGAAYSYGSVHLMVFGELIRRKLGESPLGYLRRRVFEPIGLRYAGWLSDSAGNPALPYGAWTSAREWAKFGMLLRDLGRFGSASIVPRAPMSELLRGSEAMPAYGLSVWLNQRVPAARRPSLIPQLRGPAEDGPVLYPDGPADLFAAAGHNGNRLYILPSRGLVIVRLGSRERGYSDRAFLSRVLDGRTQGSSGKGSGPRPLSMK